MIKFINYINHYFYKYTDFVSDIFLLFTRIYVADAFFSSGLIKFKNWEGTLYLFEYEYKVPFISWEVAAYFGTFIELVFPVFIFFGFLSPVLCLFLFVFNIMAVVSYPVLWDSGFYDHKLWGVMLLVNLFFGPGKISIDYIIHKIYKNNL
ncbi:DoxX family protein [Photobacterium carnosum]|uniref:DoxX family protein n=1 Tax=Photobacterium carnosum TaxID=2023717 RepID=UPI001E4FEC36|nr:DoxX family protein [Photobacterium carnosum]MCD9500362.1 DoxX family membrane protein [Photobacterium carnosum]